MDIEVANDSDANAIVDLINLAYRGSEGWTTENGIVLGERSNLNDVLADIASRNVVFLVCRLESVIQACISIQIVGTQANIGSFAVHPNLQKSGAGKSVLKLAEEYAVSNFEVEKFVMVVLSNRKELIQFYERRGYQRNGNIMEFPKHLNAGTPIDPTITFEELTKMA